jgi:hypothetical protein
MRPLWSHATASFVVEPREPIRFTLLDYLSATAGFTFKAPRELSSPLVCPRSSPADDGTGKGQAKPRRRRARCQQAGTAATLGPWRRPRRSPPRRCSAFRRFRSAGSSRSVKSARGRALPVTAVRWPAAVPAAVPSRGRRWEPGSSQARSPGVRPDHAGGAPGRRRARPGVGSRFPAVISRRGAGGAGRGRGRRPGAGNCGVPGGAVGVAASRRADGDLVRAVSQLPRVLAVYLACTSHRPGARRSPNICDVAGGRRQTVNVLACPIARLCVC